MKTGISAAIRRFIEKNIVADDPLPERSWLDQQDMALVRGSSRTAAAGLPVEPLPPFPVRHTDHGRYPKRLSRRVRANNGPMHREGGI